MNYYARRLLKTLLNSVIYLLLFLIILLPQQLYIFNIPATLTSSLEYAILYCFIIYAPNKLSIIRVFIVGLVIDFMKFNIIGITPLSFIVIYLMITNIRKVFFSATFNIMWSGFFLVMLTEGIIHNIIWAIYTNGSLSLYHVTLTMLVEFFMFPFLFVTTRFLLGHILHDEI